MKPVEYLRHLAFWAIDAKNGGAIKKNLQLLRKFEGGEKFNIQNNELKAHHEEALTRLIRHCIATVPAYRHMPLPEDDSTDILSAWPVVTKADLKNGGDKYMSSCFDKAQLIPMTTSGSTGTPFTSWQDIGKKKHVNAEVLFYNGQVGYKIGRRIIYFRSIVNEVAKSPLQQFMQNIKLLDCCSLSDDTIRENLKAIRRLSAHGGAMIMGYASTLDAFARYFEKYGDSEARGCRIYGIVSGSEMLKDSTREALSRAYNCKVVSRYANEENGFLGQDGLENNVFLHNRAHYYIEILKFDSDEPVETGETGRIVITDLYNYSMPMVRYDTGDVGQWQIIEVNGVKRKAIGHFGGRRVDIIYDRKGNIISPHAITNYMWKYNTVIDQFQFIQTDKTEYLLKINSKEPCNEGQIVCGLQEIVGEDAQISIEFCDEIPVLASGKRKYIVNLMAATQK